MTKRNGRELRFNFLSLGVLFLFLLGHKVLDSNNLKPNCWKLAGARHFPTSTFRPWSWLSSKSSSSHPVSFCKCGLSPCLRVCVPQSGPLCEGFTGHTGYKPWCRNCLGGMFQLRHPLDGLWEAKSWVITLGAGIEEWRVSVGSSW